jgi:hypothetical protein
MTRETWLDPEERAYPNGAMRRRGRAIVRPNRYAPDIPLPYGTFRAVRAGIPDTFFSIPAIVRYRGKTVRGFLTCDDGTYVFTPDRPDTDK